MTKARLNIDTAKICSAVFISVKSSRAEEIQVLCNWCGSDGSVFFDGADVESPYTDWLGAAIQHFVEHHPEFLTPA